MKRKELIIALVLGIIYIAIFLTHASVVGKTVYGDGIYYVTWLRSLVYDHDINFVNEYTQFGITYPYTTSLGLPGNKFSIGPALFWAAPYLSFSYLLKNNGLVFPNQLLIGLSSVVLVLFSLLILYRFLRKTVSNTAAGLTILSLAGATHLLFYGAIDPVNSHSIEFLATTIFTILVLTKKTKPFIVGIILGLIGAIRPQDMILGLLLIPYSQWKQIPHILIGILIGFLPQLLAWQALYGSFFVSPYFLEEERFLFQPLKIFPVLFGLENGLFLYTPITFIAFLGGISHWNRLEKLKPWIFLCIGISIIIVASWSTWWQGASYSGRMFIGMLPLFSISLAYFYQWLMKMGRKPKELMLMFVIPLTCINVIRILYFLLTH